MKLLKDTINKHKKYLEILLFFILIGFLIGLLLYIKIDHTSILNEIKNIENSLNNNHINYIVYHFIILSILITCSISIIGIIIFPLYFIFEISCISYNILSFISLFHFKGFIFALIYNLILKGIYLILLIIFFHNIFLIIKWVVINRKSNNIDLKVLIKRRLKIIGICMIGILFYDIILYLFGSKILCFWLFIIN